MPIDVGGALSLALLLLLVLGPLAWVIRHYAVLEDLRTAWRILRLDRPALAVGGLLLAGGAALVALAWRPGAPLAMGLGATLLALGAGGVAVAVANLDWYRASRRLPVVGPGDVEPGPVQLEGRAVPLGELLPSSVTGTDTLAYRAVTRQEHAVLGRGYASSTWAAVSVADGAVRFGVVDADALTGEESDGDGAGGSAGGRELPASLRAELDGPEIDLPADATTVAVDGGAAEFPLLSPTSRLRLASPTAGTLDGLERTIPAEPGTTVPVADDLDRGDRPRPREYSERRIDPGDPVYVLGTAREREDGGMEVVEESGGPPLVVVRTTAAEARAHARRFGRTYGLLGLAAFAAGAALLVSLGI